MASRNPSRTYDTLPRSTNSTSNLPSVRRNLFSSHPARRQPQASSLSTATSATAQTVHSDDSASTKEDMIVRDEDGDYRLELPSMTPMPRDESHDDKGVENRLIETYYTHQEHIRPDVLRAALQSSLQAKLTSLDEDKWMFGEDDTDAI